MDKPKSPPPPPPHATTSAAANSRPLEKIKSLLMKCVIASTPAEKPLTPQQKAFIEKRIQQTFPNIHTPDHPPYAWMIENAIRKLNEAEGSSEESISKFILKQYKDLPFAHAALLKHHLAKLTESNVLVRNPNGCYSIRKSSTLHIRASEPNPSSTNTRSLSPGPGPSPSPSPDPSCSSSPSSSPVYESSSTCSSSPVYESSSTCSSSSHSFGLKGKQRKMMKRKSIKRKKIRNAKGIKIHTRYISDRGRACGRGRGRGRGRRRGRGWGRGRGRGLGSSCSKPEDTMMEVYVDQVDDEVRVNHMDTMEIECVIIEDDVADGNIQGNEQPQGLGNQENRVDEERIEPLRQEKLVDGNNGFMANAIRSSRRKKVTRERRSENVRPRKRGVGSMRTPQAGRRRGRPRQRDNMANSMDREIEQDERSEDDMLDQLIEEVYMELQGETEIHNPPVEVLDQSNRDDSEFSEKRDPAEGMQCELNQIYEIVDLEALEPEYDDADDLYDKHLEKDVCCGTPVANEAIENQFQPQTGQIVDLEALEPEYHDADDLYDMHLEKDVCSGTPVANKAIENQFQPQTGQIVDLEALEPEYHDADNLYDKHLEKDVCSVTPVANEAIENQLQPQTGESELNLVLYEPRGQESNEIEQQLHLKGVEMEIVEEENDTDNAFEDLEEQNEHIERPELRFILVDGEKTNKVEFENVDELKSTDDPNEQELQGCTFAAPNGPKVVLKQKLLEETEEQNHALIRELENETEHGEQVQLKGGDIEVIVQIDMCEGDRPVIEEETHINKGFEVHEQNQRIEQPEPILEVPVDREKKNSEEIECCNELKKLENENSEEQYLSEKTQVGEHHHKPHDEDQNQQAKELTRLIEQAVKKADHLEPIEESRRMGIEPLTMDDNISKTEGTQNDEQLHELVHEAASDEQVQLKVGKIEITGQIDTCEGDRPLIKEENHTNKGFEVLEQNQHIEGPEPIPEHCDELKKPENQNSEEQCLSQKTQAEEHPHKPNNEDQGQQYEELSGLFLKQAVGKDDHHQPTGESKKTVKPQSRQLRPRPPKFQPDQTEGQYGLSVRDKPLETNQGRKLRPRPCKKESNEAAKRAETSTARQALQKRRR